MTVTSSPTAGRRALVDGTHGAMRLLARHGPSALLGIGALVQTAVVLRLLRTGWFDTDDINFLTTRGPVPGHDLGLWRPYAGHWSTVPLLVYRALFAVFGLHSYLPYAVVVVVVHAAIVVSLYALMRSMDARAWPAALVCWLLLFYGAGAETFMTAAAMNHSIPLLLALIACLVVVRRDGRAEGLRVAAALGVAMVMCSATGLSGLVLVSGLVGVRYGARSAGQVALPGVLAFAVWFTLYGRSAGRATVGFTEVKQLPAFLWQGFTSASGSGLGLARDGGVLLILAIAGVVVMGLGPTALRQLAVVGAGVAVVQVLLVTIGNATLGSAVASSGRYVYVVFLLLVPGLTVVVQTSADRWRSMLGTRPARPRRGLAVASALVLVGVLTAYTRVGVAREQQQAVREAASGRVYRGWVYGSIAAVDAGERQLSFQWGFLGAPYELMADPTLRTRLPPSPATDYRLDAEAQWFVQVSNTDPGLFQPTRPSARGLTGSGIRLAGCHDYSAHNRGPVIIDVPSQTGTEIGVTSTSTQVQTQLFRAYTPSAIRTWEVAPGSIYIATSAKAAILRVVLNGQGRFTICHQ